MTRKHFNLIARRIADQLKWATTTAEADRLCALTFDLAHDFAGFNPNFDRSRFITACGFAALAS